MSQREPGSTGAKTPTECSLERVQDALQAEGCNKAALAKACGLSPSAVKDMARPGWRPKTLQNLIAVERELGLSVTPQTGERVS